MGTRIIIMGRVGMTTRMRIELGEKAKARLSGGLWCL
jgi:hypothetical protein